MAFKRKDLNVNIYPRTPDDDGGGGGSGGGEIPDPCPAGSIPTWCVGGSNVCPGGSNGTLPIFVCVAGSNQMCAVDSHTKAVPLEETQTEELAALKHQLSRYMKAIETEQTRRGK